MQIIVRFYEKKMGTKPLLVVGKNKQGEDVPISILPTITIRILAVSICSCSAGLIYSSLYIPRFFDSAFHVLQSAGFMMK